MQIEDVRHRNNSSVCLQKLHFMSQNISCNIIFMFVDSIYALHLTLQATSMHDHCTCAACSSSVNDGSVTPVTMDVDRRHTCECVYTLSKCMCPLKLVFMALQPAPTCAAGESFYRRWREQQHSCSGCTNIP